MTRWLKYQRLLFTSLQCVNKLAKYIKFKHFFSKYSTKILLLLNYIFFSGKLKISNFQRTHALILLVKDLNARVPENIPKKVADIITFMQLPSQSTNPFTTKEEAGKRIDSSGFMGSCNRREHSHRFSKLKNRCPYTSF